MGFSDDMIDSLTQETYDSYGKIDIVASKKEEKFFRETTIEGYQNDKTIIEEITENEYINEEESKIFDNSISPLANDITKSHETNYKKLSVYMYKTSVVEAGKRSVVATLTWKKLPAVRSYDIFATRLTGSAEIGPNSFTGIMTQKTTSFIDSSCAFGGEVNHSTTYNSKNSAWNKKVYGIGYSAVGFTGKLKNDVQTCWGDVGIVTTNTTGYTATLSYNGVTYSNSMTAYISYQHAAKDVNYNNVYQAYTFDAKGLGKVIYFNNSSLTNSYDGMGGVTITL